MTDVNGWSIVLEKRLDERKGSYGTLFSKTRIHLLIFFFDTRGGERQSYRQKKDNCDCVARRVAYQFYSYPILLFTV